MALAVPAMRAQDEPTEERDVVIPADGVGAVRTIRVGVDDGLMLRQSGDADVQKTAHEQSKDEGNKFEDNGRAHWKSIQFKVPVPM